MGNAAFFEQLNAFFDVFKKALVCNSGDLGVSFRRRFDIHCNIIKKAFFKKRGKLFRKASVCVKFDGKAKGFNFPDKAFKVALQARFAAGDANALKNALAFFQKREHLAFINMFAHSGKNERGVMAKRAAKIAAGRENGAGKFSGEIKQGELLNSAYIHD